MVDPAPLKITTRSGTVRVDAVEGAALSVEGGSIETRDDGTLHIRRAHSSSTIEVRCATGTDVTVGTQSGKVETSGALGAVRIATVSGKIHVDEAARIDVRTKSGKIEIGTCAGECRVMTKSSAVRVAHAGKATVAGISGVVELGEVSGAEVKTISGKVLIGLQGRDPVSVHTVSGKVEISVPAASRPSTRLRSLSGKVQCDVETGAEFEIAVSSVSGAIRVSSA